MVIDRRNVLMVNNHIRMQLLTIETFQGSITICVREGY